MILTLKDTETAPLIAAVKVRHQTFQEQYPGEPNLRQPLHTIYGGAHLFKSDTIKRLGQLASRSLDDHAPDFVRFWRALRLPGHEGFPERLASLASLTAELQGRPPSPETETLWLAHTIYERIRAKIASEPVEDFRIDFEDGYGHRPDAEEDQTAISAATAFAEALNTGGLAPFMGIRIKPFNGELIARGIRTLDLFLTKLKEASPQTWPENLLITLPKVEYTEAITTLCRVLDALEARLGIPRLKIELMIETTQSVFDPAGRVALREFVARAEGRCFAAHFGTYDYTASCDIISAKQTMDNPVCDFARDHMKVALARTGVFLSDGATNVMPVGPHKITDSSQEPFRHAENLAHVHAAWRLSFDHIQNSLRHGIYQGWDLHPAQIPIRYAAVYHFFLSHLGSATERLRHFIEGAAKATLSGNVFDDAATGQGLLNFFIRAYECKAIGSDELKATGLSVEDLKTRSFPKILSRKLASR